LNNKIGNRIKQLRLQHGFTQNELGKMLYLSGQSVSKWEKGESAPSIENIDLLCKVFNISPNDLLDYKAEEIITKSQYGADNIIQSSILSFVMVILLYVLGTVFIYVFDVYLNLYPFNWIIGSVLWVLAVFLIIYMTIKNINTFQKINGRYKHIIYILTLVLSSIVMFPLISISLYQMISEMIILISVRRFEFLPWLRMYGLFIFIFIASVSIYIILLKINKKKYSRSS